MSKCMLKAKSMSKEFWTKFVSYVIYLSNCSPIMNIKGQAPQESLWDIAYARVPNQEDLSIMIRVHGIGRKRETPEFFSYFEESVQEVVMSNEFLLDLLQFIKSHLLKGVQLWRKISKSLRRITLESYQFFLRIMKLRRMPNDRWKDIKKGLLLKKGYKQQHEVDYDDFH
ncbi:hypothetical protein CR513_46338, partial [Mucuna pruriens]